MLLCNCLLIQMQPREIIQTNESFKDGIETKMNLVVTIILKEAFLYKSGRSKQNYVVLFLIRLFCFYFDIAFIPVKHVHFKWSRFKVIKDHFIFLIGVNRSDDVINVWSFDLWVNVLTLDHFELSSNMSSNMCDVIEGRPQDRKSATGLWSDASKQNFRTNKF